jgi:hypothetical protein
MLRSVTIALVVLGAGGQVAFAQGFAGGGGLLGPPMIGPISSSAVADGPCIGLLQTVEGGFFFSRYIGVGIELVRCGEVDQSVTTQAGTGATTTFISKESANESETVLTATIRARRTLNDRASMHVLAGAGIVHTVENVSRTDTIGGILSPGIVGSTTSVFEYHENVDKLAVLGGIDVEIRLTPHVSVVPTLRAYSLRRPHPKQTDDAWGVFWGGALLRFSW